MASRSGCTWLWESLAILSSLTFLLAMIALLAFYNNTKVFLYHGVTLNAIVALLSTLSKTTLLFALTAAIGQWKWIFFCRSSRHIIDAYLIDEASRGPLGSLRLVWRLRGVSLACIGALCTVLVLALDPFTQQLVQFRDVSVHTASSDAAIPRAQRFSKGTFIRQAATVLTIDGIPPNDPLEYRGFWVAADPNIQSATLYALTQSSDAVTQQLSTVCGTGNCTFSPFTSLAVCNQCVDLSDQLTASAPSLTYPMALDLSGTNSGISFFNVSNITLPNGLFLNDVDDGPGGWWPMSSFGTGNTSKTMNFRDVDTLIWSMAMLRNRVDQQPPNASWPHVSLDAVECALYYCVNEYKSSIVNGIVHETATRRPEFKRDPDSWQARNMNPHDRVTITDSLEYHSQLSFIDRTDLVLGGQFNVSKAAVDSISKYMEILFTSSPGGEPFNGYFIGGTESGEFNPESLQSLYKSDSLVATFDRIAVSLSNAIRDGADERLQQQGMAEHMETRYRIRWPWISLHAFVVLTGSAYLFITVYETSKAEAPAWKSHLLADVVLGGQIGDVMGGLATTDDMERVAWRQTAGLYHAVPDQDTSKPPSSPSRAQWARWES